MTIERHDSGPRMSKAVVHGDTVYLAGIVADAPKGKSTAEQTKSILAQIDGFLAAAGTDKSKLLSANIWIADMANFAEMNAVWDGWVVARQRAGARHRRGAPGRARLQGRDHGGCRAMTTAARNTRDLPPMPCGARGGIRSLVSERASHRATCRAGLSVRPPL